MNQNDYLLTSVHTNNLPAILKQLGISLIVSTYQAGKLIVIREDEGKINTHFRNFKKPMGLAGDRHKLALATRSFIAVMSDRNRSGKLTDFLPALRVPRIRFYSLQAGDRAADLKQLPPEITVEDLRGAN